MQIVHTDLDNTLIYSYKHEIGGPKTCVEIYQGREISFMTETSHRLLGQLCSKPGVLVVPTTTRTLEQYQRIDLGIGVPEYALVCNGGVLLHQGKEDPVWYQESLALIADVQSELQRAEQWMTEDVNRCFEVPQTGNFKEKTENKIQNEEKKIFSDQMLAYLLECLS